MNVTVALLAWPLLAVIIFAMVRPQLAVLLVFLGGWLVLPVGVYPSGASALDFPYWLVGAALPSDMLIAKAWIAPASAMLGVIWKDRQRLSGLRWSALDMPILLWCVWPLLQWTVRPEVLPDAVLSSVYLSGSWGLTWLLGRLYFGNQEAQGALLHGLAWAGLVCLPIALWEGISGPDLYAWLYHPHPFVSDGAERYLGWRPLVFFENGNQYGLWVSLCALASIWVWRCRVADKQSTWWAGGSIAVVAMAVFAQSVGALLLLGMGVVVLLLMARMRLQKFFAGVLGVAVVCGAVYLSGVVPVTHLGKETAVGRKVVEAFKASGRGSFTWRISQDQKAIALIKPVAVIGHGQWDWWRSLGTRPWGLVLLLVGQFGLMGLACAFGALLAPAMVTLWRAPIARCWRPAGAPIVLAIMTVLMALDAMLNSFIFFPALMAAGALVSDK